MKNSIILLLLPFFTLSIYAQTTSIIPQPVEIQKTAGLFRLSSATTIGYNQSEARPIAEMLATTLAKPTGLNLKVQKAGVIQLNISAKTNATIGDEGYVLEVNSTGIKLTANKPAGLFYGMHTLLQLLPKEIESNSAVKADWKIAGVKITDYPRFGWRGVMLDVSRHFFTKDDVLRYIDELARYKFNVFHWHLTDDNGWRVEIKSLPKLTEVGACRVPRYGRFGELDAPKPGEPATDCGFYTQDEVREVVKYAAERNIRILPEIDVPGHSMAAIAAYPELCCTKDTSIKVNPGSKFSEWYGNGKFKMLIDNTLNPSDENVYAFLDKVFTEIAELFPEEYVHVGGDECYMGYWEADANCQALMKRENMKNVEELHGYFMKRVEQILKSKGKKMIGWDEILQGGIAPEAAVMSWRGTQGGIEAAKMNHYVVMSPNQTTYLDLSQGDPVAEPDGTSYEKVWLKECFEFEPVPDGVDPKYILGGQGNLWTEKIPTLRHAEYMTYPRAWALSEVYWSPKKAATWENFLQRMEVQFERADVAKLNYARCAYDAIVETKVENGKLMASIRTEVPNLDIYYTVDETLPDSFGKKYTQPIEIPKGPLSLKVITYRNGKPVGKIIALKREILEKRAD